MDMYCCAQFYVSSRDLNTCPHTCTASSWCMNHLYMAFFTSLNPGLSKSCSTSSKLCYSDFWCLQRLGPSKRKETDAKNARLTRVRIQAVGWQPQGGMVTSAPGLVGVFTATFHGELLQPGGIWTLIPNCRKGTSHRARVCYHLERKKTQRNTKSGLIIERVWRSICGTETLGSGEL